MRVGFTFNLKNNDTEQASDPASRSSEAQAEWDDAETIEAVRDALQLKHEVIPMDADESLYDALRDARPDIVFNMAEGEKGPCREGQVPSILEFLGIPFTGSDPLTLNTCLDKARTKEVLAYHGLPTARFRVVAENSFSFNSLHYPLVVKPLYEGSSIGIHDNSVVRTRLEMRERVSWVLERYREPALVEEYLPGREFTVAILGNGDTARVLPIVEIKFDSLPEGVNPIYSYEAKWIWDNASNPLQIFECPARLDAGLQNQIERICLQAYRIMRCRDWCRIDLRLDSESKPHIIELNPLPGILPCPENNSCFPKAARAAGISYGELIHTVLNLACIRYGME